MGCSVMFEWDFCCNDGGSPITELKLEIKTKAGYYETLPGCAETVESRSCEVQMEVLTGEPFFLEQGDFIHDRVQISS